MPNRTPAWLRALAEEATTHRLERKLLVCRRYGDGREALRALSASGGWIGFEPTTTWALAGRLAAPTLAAEGLNVADEFAEAALLDEAIDAVLRDAPPGPLRDLADGPGFRQAMADTIRALRLSGIDAPTLARVPLRDTGKRDALVRIHDGYERLLAERRRIDPAGVFRIATQALAAGTAELPDARILILPGQNRRGLSGRLLDALIEGGARVLPDDAVIGLDTPHAWLHSPPQQDDVPTGLSILHDVGASASARPAQLALFSAASVPDEVREVLRRIASKGLHYDEVEIIATDAVTYGAALDALARRLGIRVSYAVGLPAGRTRPGRAVHAYLRWVREGFPAEILRDMLERGDLAAPDSEIGGSTLARKLRGMQIGRGRERTAQAIERAQRIVQRPREGDDERTPEEIERDVAQERSVVAALASVILPILVATPDVPDPLRTRNVPVRPSDLAHGLQTVLQLVPSSAEVDATARKRLLVRLGRIAETATRATTLDAAVAILESKLETRVPAPDTEGGAPWGATGGHLHLSDLEHGGWTNRRATFVVGLDASRFPGALTQDALLADDDRRRLSAAQQTSSLPTSAQRLEERRWAFAAMLARLRGDVTLSYCAWEAAEARTLPPAAELLQAFRLAAGNAAADYREFHKDLALATAVPKGDMLLDASDVWLGALAIDGLFRRGTDTVCAAFPHLGKGLLAGAAFEKDAPPSTWHGFVTPRPAFDPRDDETHVLSASRLEGLGSCPLRYFIRNVLRVYPPEDPVLEPDAWLTPMQRGSLLHDVFEDSLRRAREAGIAASDDAMVDVAESALDRAIATWRERVPPPGDAVLFVESAGLRDDVRAFVHMLRERGADWLELEEKFGIGARAPAVLRLPDGALIRLRGAIDRIDRDAEGLVVIDYKTGSSWGHGRQDGVMRGGRRLQHVLYSAVTEAVHDQPVVRAEYHFPTVRGTPEPAAYTRRQLEHGMHVVQQLVQLAASGRFHPTTDPSDCRFCDYVRVCRVRGEGKNPESPPAMWANESKAEELAVLRGLRGVAK